MSQSVFDRAATVVDLQRALREVPRHQELIRPRPEEPRPFDSAIVVVGATPNVGTSTMAVVLADVLAQGTPTSSVRLIDLADRHHSGLLCVADRELGEEEGGWRLSRRRAIVVERPAADLRSEAMPTLRCVPGSQAIIDSGLPVKELNSGDGWLSELINTGPVVLVCAASVPGVRRAEEALSGLPGGNCVAAVGGDRWPAPVLASAGPMLRAAHAAGRTFTVPPDKRLAIEGIDDQPISKPVLKAAARLLDALTKTAPDPTSRRRKGPIRWG